MDRNPPFWQCPKKRHLVLPNFQKVCMCVSKNRPLSKSLPGSFLRLRRRRTICEYGHDASSENAEQIDMMQDSTMLKPFQISNASIPPPSWQPPPFSGKWRYAKIISKLPQASEFHYHGLQNLPASSYIIKFLLKNCYFCCQLNCKLYFHLICL